MDYWVIVRGPDSEPGINRGLLARRGPAPPDDGNLLGLLQAGRELVTHRDTIRLRAIPRR